MLGRNRNEPQIMHIDLNSCFATIEQQANPLLRGKPIVVAAYNSPNGCVIAPSIEAKQHGIKVGMTVRDAKLMAKNVTVLTPDPPKYRDVHLKFRKLFRDYSPDVTPKSIDEAVIDFHGTRFTRPLLEIGQEIKDRMRSEIGEWLSCNVGIGTNRFLAKLAASLHKPDGLDIITHENLLDVYQSVKLTDLHGINTRYEARLNAQGIITPTDFYNASLDTLKKFVFKSINGYYWYMRLRGWEIDAIDFKRKSIGQSYALGKKTADPYEIRRLMMKLCEKMGRRLRHAKLTAQGLYVSCLYQDHTFWHRSKKMHMPMYTTQELFVKAMWLLNQQPERKVITHLAVSCFDLSETNRQQSSLFDTAETKNRRVADAADAINDKWGEYLITPALMMGMDDLIIDRVAFGGVSELQELYE